MTPEQITEVLAHVKDHVAKRGQINLSDVVKTIKGTHAGEDEFIHLKAVLESDGYYLVSDIPNYGWSVSKNPNFEITESVRKTNRHQIIALWITVGVSLFSAGIAYMQFRKDTVVTINAKLPIEKIDTLQVRIVPHNP